MLFRMAIKMSKTSRNVLIEALKQAVMPLKDAVNKEWLSVYEISSQEEKWYYDHSELGDILFRAYEIVDDSLGVYDDER